MRLLWPAFAALSGGRVLYRDHSGRRRLFLTFDDGPCRETTPRLLDLLAEHRIQATFFMVGWRMVLWPEGVEAVARRGHELGNHTMTHTRFSWLTARAKRLELSFADRLLKELGGVEGAPFRLPYAEDSPDLIAFCVGEGRRVALWSKDSLDYRLHGEDVLLRFRESPVCPGDIVLFHDDGEAAATALSILLPRWRDEGYTFGGLSEVSL